MSYINIKHISKSGIIEKQKYTYSYMDTKGYLFYMLDFYLGLCSMDPLPKWNESREVHFNWYLSKINEFHNLLSLEKRGNKYRYSITIKNSKLYIDTPLHISTGSDVVISTPYMSLEEGMRSDLFNFEMELIDPNFYTYNAYDLDINVDDWTPEEKEAINEILLKYLEARVALTTSFDDYIDELSKTINNLKDDKISKKLIAELSSVDLKRIWKYTNIQKYCDILNKLFGDKTEDSPPHVNTTNIYSFVFSYENLDEFFVKHIPHSIASEYIRYSLFDRTKYTDNIEIKMFRNIISNHGEELTDEFLKIIN